MLYDIIHLEDDHSVQTSVRRVAVKLFNLSYFAVSSLRELEEVIKVDDAKLYIIDGNFPEKNGSGVSFLAPKAIESIRQSYPQANIILFSSDERAKGTAYEYKVTFHDKSGSLVDILKGMKKS